MVSPSADVKTNHLHIGIAYPTPSKSAHKSAKHISLEKKSKLILINTTLDFTYNHILDVESDSDSNKLSDNESSDKLSDDELSDESDHKSNHKSNHKSDDSFQSNSIENGKHKCIG